MTERNRAAIDIQLGWVSLNCLKPCERYGCEGFVDFVEVDIADFQPGLRKSSAGRIDRLLSMMTGSPAVTVRPTMRAIGFRL